MTNKKNIKIIFLWLIIVILEIIIFYFSNMNTYESNSKSKTLINNIIDTTVIITNKIGITDKYPTIEEKIILINKTNTPFRKCIHFTTYFILAILIIKALNVKTKSSSKMIITVIICFLLAMFDEYHQTFINGRIGSFKDVFIDIIGSILGLYIYNKKTKKDILQENRKGTK